jgi:hypothetical protein
VQSFAWMIVASGVLHQAPAAPASTPGLLLATASFADSGRPRRPKAIQFSDAYYTRLAIHRYASYATVPLFVAEYARGQSLYKGTMPGDTAQVSQSVRSWHGFVANTIGVLFAVNTVTGVWNLWEGRAATEGRARRYVHAGLMLLSDAGFAWTAQLAPGRRTALTDPSRRTTHRTVAMISIGTSVVGDIMMLIWNKK